MPLLSFANEFVTKQKIAKRTKAPKKRVILVESNNKKIKLKQFSSNVSFLIEAKEIQL